MNTNAPHQASTGSTGNAVDPTKAANLAQQIVTILINEDSITRQRAVQAAMMLLGESQSVRDQFDRSRDEGGDEHTDASFFNRDGEMKPADYAYLCAAYHFSQFGAAPFSIAEIRAIATDAGVVVPDRLDMTFGGATKKGKKLFQNAGRGSYKPTATGSLEFGERWGVKPGRKPKTPSTEKDGGAKDAKAR